MSERALQLPNVRPILFRLGASVLIVGVLSTAIFYAIVFVIGHRQTTELRTMHREFVKLTRARAYARLKSMGLTGIAVSEPSEPEDSIGIGSPWPAYGNVAVQLPYVSRDGNGCGNYALAVLRFRGDRLVTVGETVWQNACL